ncbi:glutathione-dependent formaldehyde-activating enzyme [Rhodobiaceae bacterium]|nr:glutathione-dependent formaldehyde-activating enzyme [Rhodobiaceae bacterium]
MAHTGGCQCGAVRYEVTDDLGGIYVCHCTDCQAQSSSAFGISVNVPLDHLKITKGTPKTFNWTGGGNAKHGAFCAACGTRLWHLSGDNDRNPSVKGGTLDHAIDLTDAVHIWTLSKLPGIVIPDGCRQFAEEPV